VSKADRQNAATPLDFFRQLDARFHFNVDVAADMDNAKCPTFLTEEDDSLGADPWFHKVSLLPCLRLTMKRDEIGHLSFWCQPPFKKMMPWVEKCCQETMRTPGSTTVLLGPNSTAPWLTDFCYHTADSIEPVYPRVQFIPPPGVEYKGGNDRDQVLVVWRYRPDFTYVAPMRNDHRAVWRPYVWVPDKPKKERTRRVHQTS
jgi:phage N-6-adenine-methyltransferase